MNRDDRLTLVMMLPTWRLARKWAGNENHFLWYGLGVSPCDVSQRVNRVEVTDLLFFDQYTCCWWVCIQRDSLQFIFDPLAHVFSNSMFSSMLAYSCLFFKICIAYAEFWFLELKYLTCSRHLIPTDFPDGPLYE